jgi:hypothetical protein
MRRKMDANGKSCSMGKPVDKKRAGVRSPGLNLVYERAERWGVSKKGEGSAQPQLHVRIFQKALFSCGGSPP